MTCKERDHTKLAVTEELNSTLTHTPPSTTTNSINDEAFYLHNQIKKKICTH